MRSFIAVLCCVALTSVTAIEFKGVPESLMEQYNAAAPNFKCLNGGELMPITQVNDNFCDCLDGSDEPGTSACANGRFYCINKGFKGEFIPSARVEDGICDCCDGSDELSDACQNTCNVAASQAFAARALSMKELEGGVAMKREWIKEAAEARRELQGKLYDNLVSTEKVVSQLDAKQKELDESIAADKAAAGNDSPTAEPTPTLSPNQLLSQSLHIADMSADVLRDILLDLARKSGSQRLLVNLIKARLNTASEVDVNAEGAVTSPEEDDDEYADTDVPHYSGPAVEWADPTPAPATPSTDIDSEKTKVLRQELYDLKQEKSKLESAKADAERELQRDYGKDGQFFKLKGECIEAPVQKYTYKVCPFDSAKQDWTSLGTWKGFSDDYTVMEFTGGQSCWNGPQRSMTVTLQCGIGNSLSDVAEPATCKYTATLKTPAACSEAELELLQQQQQQPPEGQP